MIKTRKRFQTGSIKKVGKQWVVQWWENGHRRKARWLVSGMTKSEADIKLAGILAPINAGRSPRGVKPTFGEFVDHTYLPFYRGKWKPSTAEDNQGRLNFHLVSLYSARPIDSFSRGELQELLNQKAVEYSYSVVAHLRWTLRQIFRLALGEEHLDRNPAEILYIPREAKRPKREVMTKDEVKQLLDALDTRERLIAQLAIIAGMRPGEILALKWGSLTGGSVEITQRLYRGEIDTPKTHRGIREAALSEGLVRAIDEWRAISPCTASDTWVFPSERLTTPLTRDNLWNRNFLPKLRPLRLEWATFQVMRRTNSSLMKKSKVDPKVGADQRGHGIGVSLDVYTQSDREEKRVAVNTLEAALA
jgi:integrase